MQGSYDAKDVVIKVGTFDRMTGEVLSEKEVTGFAEADFTSTIERLGIGHVYGVVRKKDETDAEYEQRIIEAKKGFI